MTYIANFVIILICKRITTDCYCKAGKTKFHKLTGLVYGIWFFYHTGENEQVTIEKVINNNIVSAVDDTGTEIVAMGRGLGFGAKPGDRINEKKLEKVFYIQNRTVVEQLKELLVNMPVEYLEMTNDIVNFAQSEMKLQLNQSIYVTLSDHINFAIARHKEGISLENAILWEIKRFYKQEFRVGEYAVQVLKERLGVHFTEDEAGFIALHFVNAEYGTNISDAANFPQMLTDILDIVKREMQVAFDEESLHYERFVTHIKFLIQRIYRKEVLQDEEAEMAQMFRRKYPREYDCSLKVASYIEQVTGSEISEEERMYLLIHIRRVLMDESRNS